MPASFLETLSIPAHRRRGTSPATGGADHEVVCGVKPFIPTVRSCRRCGRIARIVVETLVVVETILCIIPIITVPRIARTARATTALACRSRRTAVVGDRAIAQVVGPVCRCDLVGAGPLALPEVKEPLTRAGVKLSKLSTSLSTLTALDLLSMFESPNYFSETNCFPVSITLLNFPKGISI